MFIKSILLLLTFVALSHQAAKPTKHALEYQRKVNAFLEKYKHDEKLQKSVNRRVQDPAPHLVFPCPAFPPSADTPTSAHAVRPSDIKVIASLGDSITAGNGVDANDMAEVALQNRGHSWCIGGDDSFDANVTTNPNIHKKFNSGITGWSYGKDVSSDEEGARLNMAIPGEIASGMANQARDLAQRIRDGLDYDWDNDWKLVTLLIGGNDLCSYCHDRPSHDAETYGGYIRDAMQVLHSEEAMPRTIVNLNSMFDITPLRYMSDSVACDEFQQSICSCALDVSITEEMQAVARGYNDQMQSIASDPQFADRDDFTIVFQSHLRDAKPPRKPGMPETEPDRTYWSPDCFHPGTKAHYAMATSLWNQMLEPVGSKRTNTSWVIGTNLQCPTEQKPYIYTNKNSGSGGQIQSKPWVAPVEDHQPEDLIDLHPVVQKSEEGARPASPAAVGLFVAGIALAVVGVVCVSISVFIVRKRKRQSTSQSTGTKNPVFNQSA